MKKEIPFGLTKKQLFILGKEELQKRRLRRIFGAHEISPIFWKEALNYMTQEEFDTFQKEWKELCCKYAEVTEKPKETGKITEKGVWRNF